MRSSSPSRSGIWLSLTYQPSYYRDMVSLPHDQREVKAKHFVAQSLQLRNDICNEPTWEAVFSDQEVNAWLAEDLVTHFADQLPPEVHEPRVLFEIDRVILAFQLEQGGVQSVITVVARPRVPEGNTVELTLEKIRAGILPVPADNVLDRIIEHARHHGVDVQMEAPGRISRGRHEIHAEPEPRGRGARGAGDPRRADPPGGPFRPHQGGLPTAAAPLAQGASIHLPQAELPGAEPGEARALHDYRINLADELTAGELHPDAVRRPLQASERPRSIRALTLPRPPEIGPS